MSISPQTASASDFNEGDTNKRKFKLMRSRMQESSNLSQFIKEALGEPESGGRFYAAIAYNECLEVRSIPRNANFGHLPEWARNSLEKALSRCGDVLQQYPDGISDLVMIDDGRIDPLLLKTPKDSAIDARDELRKAVNLGDNFLIAATVEFYFDRLESYIFESVSLTDVEWHIRRMSLKSVLCEMKGDYLSNVMPAVYSFHHNNLYEDYREFIESSFQGDQHEIFLAARDRIKKFMENQR